MNRIMLSQKRKKKFKIYDSDDDDDVVNDQNSNKIDDNKINKVGNLNVKKVKLSLSNASSNCEVESMKTDRAKYDLSNYSAMFRRNTRTKMLQLFGTTLDDLDEEIINNYLQNNIQCNNEAQQRCEPPSKKTKELSTSLYEQNTKPTYSTVNYSIRHHTIDIIKEFEYFECIELNDPKLTQQALVMIYNVELDRIRESYIPDVKCDDERVQLEEIKKEITISTNNDDDDNKCNIDVKVFIDLTEDCDELVTDSKDKQAEEDIKPCVKNLKIEDVKIFVDLTSEETELTSETQTTRTSETNKLPELSQIPFINDTKKEIVQLDDVQKSPTVANDVNVVGVVANQLSHNAANHSTSTQQTTDAISSSTDVDRQNSASVIPELTPLKALNLTVNKINDLDRSFAYQQTSRSAALVNNNNNRLYQPLVTISPPQPQNIIKPPAQTSSDMNILTTLTRGTTISNSLIHTSSTTTTTTTTTALVSAATTTTAVTDSSNVPTRTLKNVTNEDLATLVLSRFYDFFEFVNSTEKYYEVMKNCYQSTARYSIEMQQFDMNYKRTRISQFGQDLLDSILLNINVIDFKLLQFVNYLQDQMKVYYKASLSPYYIIKMFELLISSHQDIMLKSSLFTRIFYYTVKKAIQLMITRSHAYFTITHFNQLKSQMKAYQQICKNQHLLEAQQQAAYHRQVARESATSSHPYQILQVPNTFKGASKTVTTQPSPHTSVIVNNRQTGKQTVPILSQQNFSNTTTSLPSTSSAAYSNVQNSIISQDTVNSNQNQQNTTTSSGNVQILDITLRSLLSGSSSISVPVENQAATTTTTTTTTSTSVQPNVGLSRKKLIFQQKNPTVSGRESISQLLAPPPTVFRPAAAPPLLSVVPISGGLTEIALGAKPLQSDSLSLVDNTIAPTTATTNSVIQNIYNTTSGNIAVPEQPPPTALDVTIETIDLTWVDDFDPDILKQEIDAFPVKEEITSIEPKEEPEDDTIMRKSISPVDSGLGSPEFQGDAEANYQCVCGEKAIYLCKCGTATYCSTECQNQDWIDHQPMCARTLEQDQEANNPANV